MKEKITKITESLRGDMVKFLREIIAIPSMSGKEEAVVQRMKAEMQKLGYDKIQVDPLGNLLGTMGGGGKILALDGHCDTVGIGNPENWQVDPFKGDYRDGIIYGRGASDQKAGLAAAIYAGKILKEIGIPGNMSFLVVASVLEEDYEGLCWRYIIEENKIKPQAVLMTEPSNLGIMMGQRGRLEIKVHTRGISCHGSAPERGENAIYKIAPIIRDIELLNEQLPPKELLGKGTVAVTEARSSSPSLCAVADSASIHLDRRLTAGETLETAVAEIENLESVKAARAEVIVPEYKVTGYTGLDYPVKAYYPTWLMEREHALVKTAEKAYENQFSSRGDVGVWTFSTNGVTTKGVFDIPTIGFGPGEEKHAHTPYDQVPEEQVIKAVEFY
ncbi:MAG: YgeY family selenium metabolism-linked hydrolase, partial [Candidatus Aminicenantes bacterium]|nr:YgeY family selenium metabolism-linked hydrolase [Candidatus Aminicenantes bacterium]